MSTIKEVAKRAGVSIATVSYVLNESRPVKPETKELVLKAAKELNYIPNASARSLKSASSRSVGFVVPDLQNPLHANIFNSLSQSLQDHGYRLRLSFSNGSAAQEQHCIEDLISLNVNGLIIITCQPNNIAYFRQNILNRQIPVVFLERQVTGLPCHFIGLDNYKTAFFLTRQLLEKDYRQILLCCGRQEFSCEAESLRGYTDAILSTQDQSLHTLVCITGLTKEDAFRDFLARFSDTLPQAVICTNRNIAKGIQIALRYNNVKCPENLLLLSFGEESWDNLGETSDLILTSRPAMQMGDQAAAFIIKAIEQPDAHDIVTTELESQQSGISQKFPPASDLNPVVFSSAPYPKKLRILITNLQSTRSVNSLSRHFSFESGIDVEYVVHPQEDLLNRSLRSLSSPSDPFDIITYNAPWKDELFEAGAMLDLSEFASRFHLDTGRIFPENLDNCMINGTLYGIPFTAGGQILFYRRDLFEDERLQQSFADRHSISLRPPGTWKEFNHIAAFFTRKYNPESPVSYGASFAGCDDEHLAPELLIRLHSFGGGLWNSYNQPTFSGTANENAFQSVLETLNYVPPEYDKKMISDVVSDFSSGKTAMVIAFAEHAHFISAALHEEMQTKVGAFHIPGSCPVRAGWSFCINPNSGLREEAYRYLNWFCQRDTSFYLTVLNGASPFIAPYHNYELQKLYPWLQYSASSITNSIVRSVPHKKNLAVIPSGRVEKILCAAFRSVNAGDLDVHTALEQAQEEALSLYQSYGYPVSIRGFGSRKS